MLQYVLIGLVLVTLVAGGFVLVSRSAEQDETETVAPGAGLRYVALGDSYTIGEGENETSRWPNQLVKQLRDQGVELNLVANPSRTGYTTEDLLDREISVLEEGNPAFVTVLIGVNDYFQNVSASEFKQRFKTVLDTVQNTVPTAKLLIVTIPDYGKTPAGGQFGNSATIEAGLREYNQIITSEAAARNLRVADIFAISQRSSRDGELVGDGLHPSGVQYSKWLEAITPEALKLLR